jgi:large subunit ribosomal protein L18e
MAQKIQKTNPLLIDLINQLKKEAQEKDKPIWKDVALRLQKSSKNWPEVTLKRLEKHVNEKETALVPGKVLSTGQLTKKIPVAAWQFSERAKQKITDAGGKTMSIEDLLKENPEGKNVRIVG